MTPASTLHGCFVTGTDTEIGKTCVSAALLHWLSQEGYRAAGFKPVSAGMCTLDGRRVNEDVRALRDASSIALTDTDVGPVQFDAACAPHISAALEHRSIDRIAILRAARALAARAEVLVIEGVGGFRVPLGDNWDTADLALELDLPIVLVVGLRLGCINHALLTAEAIRARGLRVAGWIGNGVVGDMPWVDENVATLREWLLQQTGTPCLGVVPWLETPTPAAVAAHLDPDMLRALFTPTSAALSS